MIETQDSNDTIYVNKGTAQDNRLPQNLLPQNILVDGRDKTDLIDFAGHYAKLLRYYNIDAKNQLSEQGNWTFFTNDIIFYLAEIARTNFDNYNSKYALALATLGDKKETTYNKTLAIRLLYSLAQEHIQLVDKWRKLGVKFVDDFTVHLNDSGRDVLSQQFIQLVNSQALLMKYHKISEYPFLDQHFIASLDNDWWAHEPLSLSSQQLETQLDITEQTTAPELITKVYPLVAEGLQLFQNTLLYLVNLAERRLSDRLKRDDIKPDLGLLLGFIDLFKNAQDKINGITGRHLDLYYYDILKMLPAPLVPDSTYICFEPVPSDADIVLDAGLDFDAGKDANGNQVVFTLPNKVFVNQIQVSDLRNIYLGHNTDIETGFDPQIVTGIYSAIHNVKETSVENTWPVFGEDQIMVSRSNPTMNNVLLGFSLTSPVFFLNSGSRNVTIRFNFEQNSFLNLTDKLNTVAQHKNITIQEAFYKVFTPALQVNATSLKTWIPVLIDLLELGQNSITLHLVIPETSPAITAYNQAVHGDGYTTQYPVFEFIVQPVLPYYSYSFMEDLVLVRAIIDVKVDRLKNLSLYNQYGPLDVQNPFQPFGVQPEKGAYMLAGSNEIFVKNTNKINISFEWMNLPPEGFKKYYNGYGVNYDNQSFKVNTAILHNGQWQPAGDSTTLYTETGQEGSATIQPTSVIDVAHFKKEYTGNISPASAQTLPLYDQFAYTGFIRVELTDPPEGFGASLYSNVLSQTVLRNATEKPPPNLPLPNQPYSPTTLGVSVSYTASDQIDFLILEQAGDSSDKFYHIDVFSKYPALPRKYDTTINKAKYREDTNNQFGNCKYLVPRHGCTGELLIGLVNIEVPQSVTILFQLTEKEVQSDNGSELPDIDWWYLSNNLWTRFNPGDNIHDGTDGLIRSGIITFDLPVNITNDNAIMPGGAYWIKASAVGSIDVLGNVASIITQVATVVYNPEKSAPAERDSLILPANTITKTLQEVPGIKSLSQPFASSGGKTAEDNNRFYTRVSERLRHKKRAITIYDYERMVLENFPNVYRAKCLTSTAIRTTAILPGNIELVVIPYINAAGTLLTDEYSPVFGFTILEEIRTFIQQYASPFARISVRNPLYEKLKVHCSVVFNVNNPFYINQLNHDIMNFLSPWINTNGTVSNTGAHIQKSTIQGFIQHLDYVQLLAGFSITKTAYTNGRYYFYDTAAKGNEDRDQIYALSPWSVFVSASEHQIQTIGLDDRYKPPTPTGIDNLIIGTDFIVEDSAMAQLTIPDQMALRILPQKKQNIYNI